ncbi:Protein YIF1B-A isoform X1 [Oopsacas minuta]|uniref:Protein YIF1 n=1 Tax=Oopsacas minuta TaxID=111878 RepID=A0AAV7JMW6_9METZ|nr:Protein YIF1B-A isoform X1 [Oopsacas minuta]
MSYNYSQDPTYGTPAPTLYSNPVPTYVPPVPMYNPAPIYDPTPQPIYNPAPSQYTPEPTFDNTQYQNSYQPPKQDYMDYSTNTQSSYEFDYQQQQPQYQQHSIQPHMFLGQMASNLSGDTLATTALQYGPTLAASGKQFLDNKLDSFTSDSRGVYKSYWDVDTTYVLKKLAYLLVPFSYDTSDSFTPSPSTRSLNAPDLYIPSMSFVTYILMVGYVLGTQGRFAPNLLGITGTSALIWLSIEISISLVATYLTGMYSSGLWHRLCVLSGYKFFYMVCCIGVFGVLGAFGYYISFLLTALSSILFTVNSLKSVFDAQLNSPNKLYLNIAIALIQPLMVYWLTWHLVHYT